MAKVYTKIEIKNKGEFFELSKFHMDGNWEGCTSGEKIYRVGAYLVHQSWGKSVPIAVYGSVSEMEEGIVNMYKCTVLEYL